MINHWVPPHRNRTGELVVDKSGTKDSSRLQSSYVWVSMRQAQLRISLSIANTHDSCRRPIPDPGTMSDLSSEKL